MSEFTPGPWEVGEPDSNGQIRILGPDSEICICLHHCVRSLEVEMGHNARLIAAAPDLLSELIEQTAAIERKAIRLDKEPGNQVIADLWMMRVRTAKTAIAKALND